MQRATLYGATIGVVFLIIGAIFLGYWLDNLLGSTPWIMLGLVVLSIVGSVALKIWMAVSVAAEIQKQQQSRREGNWDDEP